MKRNIRAKPLIIQWVAVATWLFNWNTLLAREPGRFAFSENGGSITITGYSDHWASAIEIPPAIAGIPVTGIGANAFEHLSSLKRVSIPETVTNIGQRAFSSCGLTTVMIPGSVTEIGEYAFAYCPSLANAVILPGVTSIGSSMFYCCRGMTSVTIPDSVLSIGVGAFVACESLTAVTIPKAVSHIGNHAFYSCSKLRCAYFMGNAPTLGAGVFHSFPTSFTAYYFEGKTGFSTPIWRPFDEYEAVNIGNSHDTL